MNCLEAPVWYLSWFLIIGGALYLLQQTRTHTEYGRYVVTGTRCCSARLGWFLQEVPSVLLPLLLLSLPDGEQESSAVSKRMLLLCTFVLHYFHRSFIYAFRTRGRPVPLSIVAMAAFFCSVNGALQGHALLHCSSYQYTRLSSARVAAGFLLFVVGLSINIHSDNILRNLRKPGEVIYRIPRGMKKVLERSRFLPGGLFEFVSGANFFGEILEWCGYAIAVWSFPSFAFAFFTACSIGPRAYHHHRDYLRRFAKYPRSRKALIPFIL